MQQTTSSEFADWMEFLDREPMLEDYLVQVAYQMAKANPKYDTTKLQLKDFYLRYVEPKDAPEPSVQMTQKQRMEMSKAAHLAMVGLSLPDKVKRKAKK